MEIKLTDIVGWTIAIAGLLMTAFNVIWPFCKPHSDRDNDMWTTYLQMKQKYPADRQIFVTIENFCRMISRSIGWLYDGSQAATKKREDILSALQTIQNALTDGEFHNTLQDLVDERTKAQQRHSRRRNKAPNRHSPSGTSPVGRNQGET